MMVLSSKLICATDTPNSAGAICRRMRLTPACLKSSRKRGVWPIRFSAGHCNASCRTPPISTAQASAMTGGSTWGASHSAHAMNDRLSNTGVNAGTEKRLQVFSTAPAKAVSAMNRMYGKVSLSIATVTANLEASSEKPGALR